MCCVVIDLVACLGLWLITLWQRLFLKNEWKKIQKKGVGANALLRSAWGRALMHYWGQLLRRYPITHVNALTTDYTHWSMAVIRATIISARGGGLDAGGWVRSLPSVREHTCDCAVKLWVTVIDSNELHYRGTRHRAWEAGEDHRKKT